MLNFARRWRQVAAESRHGIKSRRPAFFGAIEPLSGHRTLPFGTSDIRYSTPAILAQARIDMQNRDSPKPITAFAGMLIFRLTPADLQTPQR
jgi:hypothetical protein